MTVSPIRSYKNIFIRANLAERSLDVSISITGLTST